MAAVQQISLLFILPESMGIDFETEHPSAGLGAWLFAAMANGLHV